MNDLISVGEASQLSGLSSHYLRRLYNDRKIEGEYIDGHYYLKRTSLFEFLRKRRIIHQRLHDFPKLTINQEKMKKDESKFPTIDEQIDILENRFHGDVLIYMSQFGKDNSFINSNDGMNIDDLLNGMEAKFSGTNKKFKKIILYLSSPGGLLESSIKIVDIIRQYSDSFEVIVPYMAKSAASLIALSSDMIHMTTISELGPIDPIIENPTKPGQMVPARAIDDFIKYYSAIADTQGTLSSSLSKIFENKIDPYLLGSWKNALLYSQKEIENALKNKVSDVKISDIVNIFTTDDVSHSHPITYHNLQEMGLNNVKQISGDDLNCVKSLFKGFNEYMGTNRLVKIIGNRSQCFNTSEILQNVRNG